MLLYHFLLFFLYTLKETRYSLQGKYGLYIHIVLKIKSSNLYSFYLHYMTGLFYQSNPILNFFLFLYSIHVYIENPTFTSRHTSAVSRAPLSVCSWKNLEEICVLRRFSEWSNWTTKHRSESRAFSLTVYKDVMTTYHSHKSFSARNTNHVVWK